MENFTPISAFIGGVLIGTAATMMLLFNGQITGISGIVARSVSGLRQKSIWRFIFLVGMVGGAFLYPYVPGVRSYVITIFAPVPVLIIAGLCVGFGSRLGSGCTSGHGVCGLARLSARSVWATITFMATGMITVYVMRHIVGFG